MEIRGVIDASDVGCLRDVGRMMASLRPSGEYRTQIRRIRYTYGKSLTYHRLLSVISLLEIAKLIQ